MNINIQQSTGITEQVANSVIGKIYDISKNNAITSNFIGNLTVDATYQDYIDTLQAKYPELYITARKLYIKFQDPEVERVFTSAGYSSDGVGITIDDAAGVSSIGGTRFYNNTTITNLNDLKYFTGITEIRDNFANGAINLTSVIIPSFVTVLSDTLGDASAYGAFRGCTSLINVTLNEGLLKICNRCFWNCNSLQTIDIPSTVTNLSYSNELNYGRDFGVFGECTSLTTITGGENITILGNGAFYNCSSLQNLPDINFSNITKIGSTCFNGCGYTLGQLNLQSLTYLGKSAFWNCTTLTSINIPLITNIPDGEVSWKDGTFQGCSNLTTVTGNNLQYIGKNAFRYCSSLSSINLSNCVTVASSAFHGTALTSVDLSSCTSIGNYAFYNCTSLANITLSQQNITSIGDHAFTRCPISIELNLTSLTGIIDSGAFYNTGITKIKSLGNITRISSQTGSEEHRAFGKCTSLTEVDLSTTPIESIGISSFAGCTSLITVKLPSTLTSISEWAFNTAADTIQNRTYYIYATTPPTITNKNCLTTGNSNVDLPVAIYVPYGCGQTYKTASVWSQFESVIQEMPQS